MHSDRSFQKSMLQQLSTSLKSMVYDDASPPQLPPFSQSFTHCQHKQRGVLEFDVVLISLLVIESCKSLPSAEPSQHTTSHFLSQTAWEISARRQFEVASKACERSTSLACHKGYSMIQHVLRKLTMELLQYSLAGKFVRLGLHTTC